MQKHACVHACNYPDAACDPQHTQSKLRDEAWPTETKNTWGTDREAVRTFLKKEWKDEKKPTAVTITKEGDASKAAEAEAKEILKVNV